MIDVKLCLIRLSSVNAVDETSDFLNFCCASCVKSFRTIKVKEMVCCGINLHNFAT